jgi:hypothetical protein
MTPASDRRARGRLQTFATTLVTVTFFFLPICTIHHHRRHDSSDADGKGVPPAGLLASEARKQTAIVSPFRKESP